MADGDLEHAAKIEEARCLLNLAIGAAEDHGLRVEVSAGMPNRINPNPGAISIHISRSYSAREIAHYVFTK